MTLRDDTGQQPAAIRCPFLMEVDAQYCQLAPFRKLVPGFAIAGHTQRCSSNAWRSCEWVLQRRTRLGDEDRATRRDGDGGPEERCPFLDEILACSCTAAPSTKLIPRTLLAVSRCLGDSHRYCEYFLDRACPPPSPDTGSLGASPDGPPLGTAGIPIRPDVAFAPNHMWLDVGPDGSCHVGVDALIARVLGGVDEVAFLSACGPGSPRVAIRVAGTVLPLVFPQPFDITGFNGALRRHPDALTSDPYRRGWLYEGRTLGPGGRNVELRRGPDAETWMASEVELLSRHVHTILSRRGGQLGPISADGGGVSEALAQHLGHTELLEVFSLFFTVGSG